MTLDDNKTEYFIQEGWFTSDVTPKKRKKKGKGKKTNKEPMGFHKREAKDNGR